MKQSTQNDTTTSNYSYNPDTPRQDKTITYTQTPHYTARIKYNNNRELYAPSCRPASNLNAAIELDFYSTATRQAVPYNPVPQYTADTKTARASVPRQQYSNVYSEDEGIVINSESDSSVSQFATYDNREKHSVTGPPKYKETYMNSKPPPYNRQRGCTFDNIWVNEVYTDQDTYKDCSVLNQEAYWPDDNTLHGKNRDQC